MVIATWNLERPTLGKKAKLAFIHRQLSALGADILVLTETNHQAVRPDGYFFSHSSQHLSTYAGEYGPGYYGQGENRVTIHSRFPIVRTFSLQNPYAAACCEVLTHAGPLVVYGTIFGTRANWNRQKELEVLLPEIDSLARQGCFCLAGDFNLSFSDNYMASGKAVSLLNDLFARHGMLNATAPLGNTIDHIALSRKVLRGKPCRPSRVEIEKSRETSDHSISLVTIG